MGPSNIYQHGSGKEGGQRDEERVASEAGGDFTKAKSKHCHKKKM